MNKYMENIKQPIFLAVLLFCFSVAFAQQERVITGIIKDSDGEALIGAAVIVKDQPGLGGVTSDLDGKFTIKTKEYDILSISYTGFETKDVPVASIKGNFVEVILKDKLMALDEVVVTSTGTQRKITVTGAITNVDVKSINSPTANVSNSLAGNVPGIIAVQRSGEPGENASEFWIRGISTFGANASALVLVDGVERDFNEINVEDIESFSILKDASATAVYGQRGANGVILITTRKGVAGKISINFKSEYGYNTRSRTPEYVDGLTYAKLANEAKAARYESSAFTDQDMVILEHDMDRDLRPNVNWRDVLLKNGADNYRFSLSMSGGGENARYFISGAYYNEDGMYITNNELNKYNTNATYERYNYRANVDVNLTKSTLVKLGIGGYLTNQTKPGSTSTDIWKAMNSTTPLSIPRMFSTGQTPSSETSYISPEVLLTRTGYKTIWDNKVETNITLDQQLDFITPGLRFSGTFAFDTKNHNEINRIKKPELYRAESYRDAQGKIILTRVQNASQTTQETTVEGERRYYTQVSLDYARVFNQKHRATAFAMLYMQERQIINKDTWEDLLKSIPYRNMAYSGRMTYGYDNRYLAEFNWGFTGSENFEKGEQFGFFPAYSVGWNISEEAFVKDNIKWLSLLKLRMSYGLTGNDKIGGDKRFPYISLIGTSTGTNYGEFKSNLVQGYRMLVVGSEDVTWEISEKKNIGLDLNISNGLFTVTFDVFEDYRKDIFMQRAHIPYTAGLQDIRPYANLGRMKSQGFDGSAAWSAKINKVSFTLRGNVTFAKTKVLEYDEAANALYYQMTRGYRLNQTRGYISLGLFKDQDDVDNSPRQTFGGYAVLPGDIKYKDVNGDGIIDDKDKVPIGTTTTPNLMYGMGLSLFWNNFEYNMLFQGAGESNWFIGEYYKDGSWQGGEGVFPFHRGPYGNVLTATLEDRWIAGVNEDPNAKWPRLTYGMNNNNKQQSTFWMQDGQYLRLKNIELAYYIPKKITRKLYANTVRLGFIGYNLFVWSPFKLWDPEAGSSDGSFYPIQKTYSFSLSINF